MAELRAGERGEEIPPHGTLIRVERTVGLEASKDTIAAERATARAAAAERATVEGS